MIVVVLAALNGVGRQIFGENCWEKLFSQWCSKYFYLPSYTNKMEVR